MLVTLSVTFILVILCVILHYEALSMMRRLGNRLHQHSAWHRWHLSILVCSLLIVHVFEIVLFGLVYFWLIADNDYGVIAGSPALLTAPISRS